MTAKGLQGRHPRLRRSLTTSSPSLKTQFFDNGARVKRFRFQAILDHYQEQKRSPLFW